MNFLRNLFVLVVLTTVGVMVLVSFNKSTIALNNSNLIINQQKEFIKKANTKINDLELLNHNLRSLNINQKNMIASLEKDLNEKRVFDVIVTFYTLSVDECNEDLKHNASMNTPKPGDVAISRDLFYSGKLTFGDKLYVKGIGTNFNVADLMHWRYGNPNSDDPELQKSRIDIFVGSKEYAMKMGKLHRRIVKLT